MKKLIALTLTAVMTLSAAGFTMAGGIPEGYTQTKVFDGSYGFGEAEITISTNDDLSAFYITFECFDEEQILEGTVADGVVTVDYDLTGFVSGDAQQMWDDAMASENAWEGDGAEAGEAADAAADEASEAAQADESADGASEEAQMPTVPTAESDDYTGFVRDYDSKEMWFDSTIYGGFYSAYQIVQGNGDDTFDIDAFINSQMGEKVLERIKYELVLLGDDKVADDYMIQYWQGRGIIETPNYMDDEDKAYVTYVPDYMTEEGNDKLYPVVFDYHGGGGTMFEATDHGWVEICYDNEFMVVVPNRVDAEYLVEDMDAQLAEMEAAGLPIDYTRIYCVGQSMGGMASFLMAAKNNSKVAAIAANSSARGLAVVGEDTQEQEEETVISADWNVTEEDLAATNYAPVMLQLGTCDMAQLPLSDDNVTGLGKWLAANGLTTVPEKTDDNVIGITADKVFTKRMDGAVHTFAQYLNENGVVMAQIIAVEGMPHWTAPSFAVNGWEFLSQFSRVDGQLVIAE